MTDLFGSLEWRCALLDPPWAERGGGKIKRGADRHYGLVGKLGDVRPIHRVIVDSGMWTPAANAHCWIWYTDNFLPDALELVRLLGFTYKRTFQWVKVVDGGIVDESTEAESADDLLRMGIGQYGRGCHEGLLFATRGKGQDESVWTGDRAVRSVFHAPHVLDAKGKRVHSAKPPKSYELIERVSKGPRIEFFARSGREGWAAWGNQAPEVAA